MAKQLSETLKTWRSQLLDTSKRNRLVNCKFARGGAVAFEHPGLAVVWDALVVAKSSMIFQETDALLVGEIDEPTLLDSAAADADVDPSESAEAEEAETNAAKKSAAERNSLSAKQVAACRESDDLYVNAILTKLTDKALDGRLKRLSVAANTSLSEQGVNSLFVACGFLKWFESNDSEEAILSPLVLVPVSLSRETAESEWELSALDDELVPNHPLAEILKNEFKITLPPFTEDELDESSAALESFFEQVRAAVPKRWTVEPTVALGTFAFQKIAMWHDLRDHENAIIDNAICRGMAGDGSAMPTSDGTMSVTENDLDVAVPLESHHLIVDCDSSQLAAIQAVKQGRNLILDGPPGTGKSQTIANIIAECLAAGKTVLFVSEKAAALEVVKRRLDKAGVGDFCLELHSHKANKKHIIDELGKSLTRPNERYQSVDQKLAELRRSRDKLNDYVRALHVEQSRLKQTPFKMHGRLAQIHTTASTRVMIENPFALDENSLGER